MDGIRVWWVIDRITDRIVGSSHRRQEARVIARNHFEATAHSSKIRKTVMTADHVRQ